MGGMSLRHVQRSLEQISKGFADAEEKRERILKDSREIVLHSSKAIVAVHVGRLDQAKELIKSARTKLKELSAVAEGNLHRYLTVPMAEYVEASLLYSISQRKAPQSHVDIEVDGVSYILGLLDTIGEVKRMIYDRIREGNAKEALRLFELIEQMYTLALPLVAYDHIAPGAKRKADVSRRLIEDVRAVVTEEARRKELIDHVTRLSRRLDSRRKRRS